MHVEHDMQKKNAPPPAEAGSGARADETATARSNQAREARSSIIHWAHSA